jgi:hypothetical protein
MLGAVVEHLLVIFVGNGDGIPSQGDSADSLELGELESQSRPIVGRVENDGVGFGAEGGREFLRIKCPIGRA